MGYQNLMQIISLLETRTDIVFQNAATEVSNQEHSLLCCSSEFDRNDQLAARDIHLVFRNYKIIILDYYCSNSMSLSRTFTALINRIRSENVPFTEIQFVLTAEVSIKNIPNGLSYQNLIEEEPLCRDRGYVLFSETYFLV